MQCQCESKLAEVTTYTFEAMVRASTKPVTDSITIVGKMIFLGDICCLKTSLVT